MDKLKQPRQEARAGLELELEREQERRDLHSQWRAGSKEQVQQWGYLGDHKVTAFWVNELNPFETKKRALLATNGKEWYLNDPFDIANTVTLLTDIHSEADAKDAAVQIWQYSNSLHHYLRKEDQ